MSRCRPAALVGGLLILPSVSAQAAPESALEETVVVANRVPTAASLVGLSVDVVDREALDILGYSSLSDVLDVQTGVSVTTDGGLGKTANVRIRGEEGFRTRILLDGIDIADPSSPQIGPRIEQLMTAGFDRIEILRGPQGLVYGADAGGVIALTSRQPGEGAQGALGLETGANGFTQIHLHGAAGNKWLSGALSITDLRTDGFNARKSDNQTADRDGYDNQSIHGTVTAQLNTQWQLGATAHRIEGDNEYDGCYNALSWTTSHDCTDDFEQKAWRVFASWVTETLSSTLSYESNVIRRGFATERLETFSTEGENNEISWLNQIRITDQQRLVIGADWLEQGLLDGGAREERRQVGVYADYQLTLHNGAISVGLRHDDNDDFGQHQSWRLSAVHGVGKLPIQVHAAAGSGFRAPSLYEIAYNAGPYAYGAASSTELSEEQSAGWEAGLKLGNGQRYVDVTWFDQRIEDEIYFDLMAYTGYLQRQGEATSQGVELAALTPLGAHWQLKGNLSWMQTEDHAGKQRPYRPERSAALSLRWQGSSLDSALTLRHAGDLVDTYGSPMDNYTLLDWSARYRINPQLSLTARLENLTDEDFEQVRDYYGANRRWFLGVNYQL